MPRRSRARSKRRPAPVPEREGELAVQALAERLAVLLIEVDEDLAVRVREEAMAVPHEVLPEVGIVEDLAVEDGHHAVVLVAIGLMAARYVHDGEPPGHEAGVVVALDREAVGTAVL